jgi:DNA mismatch repair protein MutS
VFNLNVQVREEGGRVVFLHRVADGASDRSYGIHVAELAGAPREVTDRATELLERLQSEAASPASDERAPPPLARRAQAVQTALPLVVESDVENELRSADLAAMTPIEALNFLHDIQRRLRARSAEDPSKVVRMRRQPGRDPGRRRG